MKPHIHWDKTFQWRRRHLVFSCKLSVICMFCTRGDIILSVLTRYLDSFVRTNDYSKLSFFCLNYFLKMAIDIMCQYSAYLSDWEQNGTLNWIKTNSDETLKQMRPVSSKTFQSNFLFRFLFFLVCWQNKIPIYLQHYNTSGIGCMSCGINSITVHVVCRRT